MALRPLCALHFALGLGREGGMQAFEYVRPETLGAAVPCYRIYGDSAIAAAYPALVDSVSIIGGTAIQGRATVGGNLCNASPSGDSIPSLIVYGATCLISGPSGTRTIPVAEFCVAPGTTRLEPGELLVSVELPP